MHRVGAGETLAMIGKRYGSTPGSILAANNLLSAEPVEGDRLLIPAVMRADPPAHTVASASAARRLPASRGSRSRTAAATPTTPARPPHKTPLILTRAAAR
jgi:LysM repeat protein